MNTKPIRLIVSLFWLLAFVFPSLAPAAITLLDGVPWVYEGIGGDDVRILHGPGCGDVTIPSTLDCYIVRLIGPSAFANCTGLTSVTIPDSVVRIESNAFAGCTGLQTLCLPVSLAGMPDAANSGVPSTCAILYGDAWEDVGGVAWSYVVEDGKATVTAGPRHGDVSIPSVLGGYPVTSIGSLAFFGCKELTSVTIPDSVTNIEYEAFDECSGLTNMTIPDNVTDIGSEAFYHCNGLTAVTIGNGVTSIGEDAFAYCSNLSAVNIHDLKAWCEIDFNISGANPLGFTRHLYLDGEEVAGDLVIPDGTKTVGKYAFHGCTNLMSVKIPDSVTNIDYEAFSDCNGLTAVNLGKGVRSIGMCAFSYSGLTAVTIPDSVTSIGNSAFFCCSNLMSVTIPNSVTNIESHAFSCSGLTEVTIPDSVTSIGYSAFSGCSNLTSVTIPNSVTNIERFAFSCCSNLTSVTIPNSVTDIGNEAFSYCSGLPSLTIPESVTNIGAKALYSCNGLKTLYAPASWESKYVNGTFWRYHAGVPSGCNIVYYEPDEPKATTTGVPYSWLAAYGLGDGTAEGYEGAANAKAANGRKVWECYWAGLNPGDADKDFTTAITFSNGVPNISWEPDLGTNRTYIVEGSEEMDGAWGATNASTRFFRTKIAIEEPAP